VKPGTKPKPSALRVLQGKVGHSRPINRSEPKPDRGVPVMPAAVARLPYAKAEWDDLVPELHRLGLLTRIDRAALTAYCISYHRWLECEDFVFEHGAVMTLRNDKGEVRWVQPVPQAGLGLKHLEKCRQFLVEFGLTPSSRSRLSVTPAKAADPVGDFLYGAKKN
jgi:P27 family predicted phage terminase small subunit